MSTLKNKLKLKKIASDDFQYIFESPIVITLYNETMNQDLDTDDLEYYSECLDNLKEAVNNEMKEMGNKGLAEYLDDEFLEKVVKSIEVSIEDFKAKTKVITNSELNESNIICQFNLYLIAFIRISLISYLEIVISKSYKFITISKFSISFNNFLYSFKEYYY